MQADSTLDFGVKTASHTKLNRQRNNDEPEEKKEKK